MADVDGDVLCRAEAAWETIELASYTGFHAYDHYPTQAEIDAGLQYPHTLRVIIGNRPRVMTIGNPVEVIIDWMIETYVVVGKDINDMASLQAKSGRMALSFVKGFLMHRTLLGLLAAPYNGALVTLLDDKQGNGLHDCGFGVWDMFGMGIVGHKWAIQRTTRQTMTVGS